MRILQEDKITDVIWTPYSGIEEMSHDKQDNIEITNVTGVNWMTKVSDKEIMVKSGKDLNSILDWRWLGMGN